jgi:magnesium transporter
VVCAPRGSHDGHAQQRNLWADGTTFRFLPDAAPPLFADIADQFEVIKTMADGQREFLHGVIEFYQTRTSTHLTIAAEKAASTGVQQNDQVKRISAWAAILFAPTLVGTIYGMNFDYMPELGWRLGYPLAILAMVVLGVGLYVVFERKGWL